MTSYCRTPLTFSAHQKPSVGDSKFSAVTSDHMGWVLCDGRLLSVTQFQFLFNLIGYSFGGSGTQFRLPNAAGRVPGAIGTGSDQNNSTFTAILGLSTGEYMHQLTIGEMPSHNHGVAGGGQVSSNTSTSRVSTSITLTDPGHQHGYLAPNPAQPQALSGSAVSVNDRGLSTTLNFTGIVLNDPTHAHTLNPAGGDQNHNNVQPTLFMGNMFIYSGLVNYPSFLTGYPYTNGKNIY
jgi:microcystin-dependent protein